MPSLMFVMPAYGRLRLAEICMRQLRRTCDVLIAEGIVASAVVVADDGNLTTARRFGFATVRRDNKFVSRKFNDGFALALDGRFNSEPADYVVPIGSDDWVDHRLFLTLPGPDTVIGFQWMGFVDETGTELVTKHLNYQGGAGIRIYPREVMEPLRFRPADEDRARGCDTSTLVNLIRYHGDSLHVEHWHLHEHQIIDWKTHGEQLNAYRDLRRHRGSREVADPFVALVGVYPDEALEEMAAHYGRVAVAA